MASFAPGIHPGTWAAFSNTKNLKLLGAYSVILQQKGPSQSHQRLPHGSPGWQQMPWGACREDGHNTPCLSPFREGNLEDPGLAMEVT